MRVLLALGPLRRGARHGAAVSLHRDSIRLWHPAGAAFGINPDDPDTNAVVHGGEVFFKSGAALTVLSLLPGWRWVRVLRSMPKPLRDAVYNLVARNRYRIFGKYETCFLGDAGFRDRVME